MSARFHCLSQRLDAHKGPQQLITQTPGKARLRWRMAKKTKSPSAVFWGVYKLTPEGLELLHGTGRKREEAVQTAARQLGFPPYSEHLLIAAGWTIGKLRAFVEED